MNVKQRVATLHWWLNSERKGVRKQKKDEKKSNIDQSCFLHSIWVTQSKVHTQRDLHAHTSPTDWLTHTRKKKQKTPWPRCTKAISGSTFESRMDESTQKPSKDQTTEWKSNSTPKYTHAHLFSLSRFCWETHWKTDRKGIKPQGMTIVTVNSAPTPASASALSSSLSWQTSESPVWVKYKMSAHGWLYLTWRMELLSSSLIFC